MGECDLDHGFCGGLSHFVVFGEPSEPVEPVEDAFNDPAFEHDFKHVLLPALDYSTS